MSSSSEDEKNRAGPSTPKKTRLMRGDAPHDKTKHRIQKFRSEWEKDPPFSPWLKPAPNDNTKARCTWCNVGMRADISVIKLHKNSKKHLKTGSALRSTNKSAMLRYVTPTPETTNCLEINGKDAEIKLCGFIAAHNIAFSIADDLIPCLKSAFPDSKILKEIHLKRLKATKIVTNVIGASHKDQIAEKLKKSQIFYID
ncbi:hypothetical protein O0L34_g17504 [Tuta absoluta]|nr:hypothetical protein O0L34_g17504 [Tuta absoluta]